VTTRQAEVLALEPDARAVCCHGTWSVGAHGEAETLQDAWDAAWLEIRRAGMWRD
jgi:hypothetical protein